MTLAERNIIFEDLFKSHFHQLYVHAYRWVNDEECAKDIVHDSFCYLWEHFEHYTDHSRLLPLLYTFVKSRSIDYLRQSLAKEHYLQEQAYDGLSSDESYDGYEEWWAVPCRPYGSCLPKHAAYSWSACSIDTHTKRWANCLASARLRSKHSWPGR